MSQWQLLLDRVVIGLDRLRATRQPAPPWVLGGGTALLIHVDHRLSKDIDAFIDDPQYLTFLSPRLAGEDIWACEAYEEAGNHLKLIYPEGEIDFIVAAPITDIPAEKKVIDMSEVKAGASHVVDVEHPVEIALKKLNYRGSMLKVRDIFDIAVVDSLFADLLRRNLHHVAHVKSAIANRLSRIPEAFSRRELSELAIIEAWRPVANTCLQRMREIADSIPDPKADR